MSVIELLSLMNGRTHDTSAWALFVEQCQTALQWDCSDKAAEFYARSYMRLLNAMRGYDIGGPICVS